MKALAREFSMTRSLCLGAAATVLALPAVAQAACGPTTASTSASGAPGAGLAPDIVAAGQQPRGYPSFCDIPKIPTDVRGVAEWKAAVLDIRRTGANLQRETAPDTWTLDGSTAGFAAESRSEAAAPPPMNPDQDTDAFARQLRDRATPPPRPR